MRRHLAAVVLAVSVSMDGRYTQARCRLVTGHCLSLRLPYSGRSEPQKRTLTESVAQD